MTDKDLKEIISNPEPQFERKTKISQPLQPRRLSKSIIKEMIDIINEGEEIRRQSNSEDEALQL